MATPPTAVAGSLELKYVREALRKQKHSARLLESLFVAVRRSEIGKVGRLVPLLASGHCLLHVMLSAHVNERVSAGVIELLALSGKPPTFVQLEESFGNGVA